MQGWRGETAMSLDTGSGRGLSSDEEKLLRVHIKEIRIMEDANPACIGERSESSSLDGWVSACNDFSGKFYNVPVALIDEEKAANLLGMSVTEFLRYIELFWRDVTVSHDPEKRASRDSGAVSEHANSGRLPPARDPA